MAKKRKRSDNSRSARFHWLVAPRSTIIQVSPTHAGVYRDEELGAVLDQLFEKYVRVAE